MSDPTTSDLANLVKELALSHARAMMPRKIVPETMFADALPHEGNPARDATFTSAAEATATLELHAAQLDKSGAHGIAYDLRVAAHVIRQMDPDRPPKHGLDWHIDIGEDGQTIGRCPECESENVALDYKRPGWIECLSCHLTGK